MYTAENIHFFNTLARAKERFVPIEEGKAKVYTCGLTVYDYGHIGNYRAFIFEDLLRRWLEYRGFKVVQVMNLTDVDDKTIKRSKANNVPLREYTKRYIEAFFDDISTLNIEKAEYYPKATDHIPEMIALVKSLLDKGYAYRGDDGSIYYDISKFQDYGKLAKIKVEELMSGARVKGDEYAKEEACDFVLWKAWDSADGDIFWETEFGKGRPGWHIECSAMSMKYLGASFDIHCGGVDNLFPHHENEIAQSEAATGRKFVNYWLHNEFLLVEGKKMAKRLGNFYTLRDVTEKGYDPKAVRYLMISTHYRQQLNFTFASLDASKSAVDRMVNFVRRLQKADGTGSAKESENLLNRVQVDFEQAMDDDLNTGSALAALFNFIRDVNNLLDRNMLSKKEAKDVYDTILQFDKVIGVIGTVRKEEKLPKEAEELISIREEARKAKDWKKADRLREELKAMGVIVEDTPHGVEWKFEKRREES